ncbi:MAG TPA: response regulator transcription factor [Pirellulales bacterium]|nr:response regulator transcription factor [Pirellulales bacterium]
MERARILIADDNAEFLAMAVQLIESESDLSVVKTFNNGQTIVNEAAALNPDLLVVDISMPGLSGIQAALKLIAANRHAKIVFLTVHKDQDYLRAALATGALGYIVKDRLAIDLVPGLREVIAGRRFVSPISTNRDAAMMPDK